MFDHFPYVLLLQMKACFPFQTLSLYKTLHHFSELIIIDKLFAITMSSSILVQENQIPPMNSNIHHNSPNSFDSVVIHDDITLSQQHDSSEIENPQLKETNGAVSSLENSQTPAVETEHMDKRNSGGEDKVENDVVQSELSGKQEDVQTSVTSDNHGDDDEVAVNNSNCITTEPDGVVRVIPPHSLLPKPEVPPGIFVSVNDSVVSVPNNATSAAIVDIPSIGKFIRERSNDLSLAITKRLSSFKDSNEAKSSPPQSPFKNSGVTEFDLSGLKVIVRLKTDEEDDAFMFLKGRLTFYSRSKCRDCTAVRKFFREKGLRYMEINIDVYTEREKELFERTGTTSVPQIFFNEKLIGGLVVLNSLRNSGGFDKKVKEMLSVKCPDNGPQPPVYGCGDETEEGEVDMDGLVGVVRVLRQRLPIQDRLMKMKIVKNCFSGAEMVEELIHYLDCGRKKAVEIGKQLAKKHFIHHVFGENDFVDGNQYYRFLEHETFIPKCFNFHGATNDCEPKPAAMVSQRLTKIMTAILEAYASDDRRQINYAGISNSEEFRRYTITAQELQRVNLLDLSENEKLAFFLNLFNAMVIHAVIRTGGPESIVDRRAFFSDFQYVVGGHAYSLDTIKNGILRSNRRPPYSFVKPFATGDKRLELAVIKVNPLVHFGLCDGTKSSPPATFFSTQGVESELRTAAREFFKNGEIKVDLEKRTVYLTRILKWYSADFGSEKEILKWVISYLDANKAGLLTHLLDDGGHISISYPNYNWSANAWKEDN